MSAIGTSETTARTPAQPADGNFERGLSWVLDGIEGDLHGR
ncbi:hypothetical protein ACNF49_16950 [Actinomadura sp. ATCC 39365]